jgi:hypothetical protein
VNRAGVGAPPSGPIDFGEHGPTMRQLMALYDPALVSLLVPGMVVDPRSDR